MGSDTFFGYEEFDKAKIDDCSSNRQDLAETTDAECGLYGYRETRKSGYQTVSVLAHPHHSVPHLSIPLISVH